MIDNCKVETFCILTNVKTWLWYCTMLLQDVTTGEPWQKLPQFSLCHLNCMWIHNYCETKCLTKRKEERRGGREGGWKGGWEEGKKKPSDVQTYIQIQLESLMEHSLDPSAKSPPHRPQWRPRGTAWILRSSQNGKGDDSDFSLIPTVNCTQYNYKMTLFKISFICIYYRIPWNVLAGTISWR